MTSNLSFTNSHVLIINQFTFVKWKIANDLLNEKCKIENTSARGAL